MILQREYGDTIWTDHAMERMGKRGLTQELALQAFNSPDSQSKGTKPGTQKFSKQIGKSTVTVIAKRNESGKWLILSCWVMPPLTVWGSKEDENYQKFKQAGFWGKLWYTFKKQIFG